jgi:outer membrane lipoprotein-sorting protein
LNQIFNNKQSLKMKKVLGLLVVATMVAFTACTKTAETANEEAEAVVEETVEAVEDAAATADSTIDATVDSVKAAAQQ